MLKIMPMSTEMVVDHTSAISTKNKKNLGHSTGKPFESRSGLPTALQNTSVGNLPLEIDTDPLLQDILFSSDVASRQIVMRLYRDIYYNDAIGGSAVDLYSSLPFSEFNLGGITNDNILEPYMETVERLNIRTLLNEISVDYLVTGTFIGSLLYNKSKSVFTDIMTHRSEDTDVIGLPFYGQDPIVTASVPSELRTWLNAGSNRAKRIRDMLGPDLLKTLSQERIELDPISTIFIPRKTFSTNQLGTSYYRRILPLYLVEKNLFRGTLVESSRRQRGILHLTLGDGDQWEPTLEDMEAATDLFSNADADPLGAIIATRMGVSTEEVRAGGEFWRVTDLWDQTGTVKLRALGIGESFLSGEASYNSADTSLTVFVESLRAYRDSITRKLFYNKIFPLVSLANGYMINSKGKVTRREGLLDGDSEDILKRMQDGSKLLIPTVHWAKQLKPEGDTAYFEMLSQMSEKGVPVPLRAFAAAGGFNLDQLIQQQPDDFKLQKKIYAYQKALTDLKKEFGPKIEEGEESTSAGLSDNSLKKLLSATPIEGSRSSVIGQTGRQGLLDRDFGDASEVTGTTRTGKKKAIYNQKIHQERANVKIMKALKSLAKDRTPLTTTTVTPINGSKVDLKILNRL
jgi:hypothetical protein